MMAGGLWWTEHAHERLQERFGMSVREAIHLISPATLAGAIAVGAHQVKIGRLNMCLVLSGGIEQNSVLTVIPAKNPKRKRPRWREADDE